MATYLIYHDNCLDGFVSGMLAYFRLKEMFTTDKLVVVPGNYSDKPVDAKAGDTLILVDFSYPSEKLEELLSRGVNISIEDHHKSFVKDLESNKSLMSGARKTCNDNYITYSRGVKFTDSTDSEKRSGSFQFHLAENESGASLVMMRYTNSGQLPFSLDWFELINTVTLTKTHDLWLHGGDETSQAYALSHWFKKLSSGEECKALRYSMKKNPETSERDFAEMISKFIKVPLSEKVEEALTELKELDMKMSELADSDKVKKVKLKHFSISDDVKICYVQDPEISKIGISIMGSYLSRKRGWGIAILDAVVDDDRHIFSIRSNDTGKDVDVSEIAKWYFENGYAVSGGGHRNAAGVVFTKEKKTEFFELG